MNKELIKNRFSRSISTYDKQAQVQLQIAERLSAKASEILTDKCDKVLEIGCGTGFLTRKILDKIQIKNYYLNDLVDNLETRLRPIISKNLSKTKFSYLEGDAEVIDFPSKMSAVLSASTVQWFDDFDGFLTKVNNSLSDEGYFLFNSFGPENLCEIKKLIGRGLCCPAMSEVVQSIDSKLELLEYWEETHYQYFDSPIDVLRHLQETGVNASTTSFKWNKTSLHNFEERYRIDYSHGDKVKLSWHVYYFVTKKKNSKNSVKSQYLF